MKRRICESLFAVTLALTVAVTNIPVSAFATEIDSSARQEQTSESTQNGNDASGDESENQGQVANGSQESQGKQNGSNAENGQDKSDDLTGTNQNTGVSDNTESETKKDDQYGGNNSQTEQVGKKDNTSEAETGTSGQQNMDADQQEEQANEQAAVLSSNESVWELHKGEITQTELKNKLGGNSLSTYRWSKDKTNWVKTSLYGNPTYTFDTGIYYFQKETVTWTGTKWNDIGTKEIHVYYNMNINVYGSSEGAVYNGENQTVPLNSTFQVYDNKYKFTVKNIKNYEAKVTATVGSQGEQELTPDANGMYEVVFNDDVTVKVEYIATNYADVKVEQTENADVYINGTLAKDEDIKVNLKEKFEVKIVPKEGYAVDSVTVDEANVSDLSFEKHVTIFSWYSGEVNKATINIRPKVVKEVLALKENATVSYHDGITLERLKNNIFNSVVDKNNSVPNNITVDEVDIEYKVKGIFKDKWKTITENSFEGKSTETIRVSYKGNSQYWPLKAETTVNISDERIETQVVIQEGITIQCNTEDVMRQELLQYIIVQDKDGNELPVDKSELKLSYDRTVGEQELTVSYAGDDDYKDSTAKATITITKGDATVSVNSQKITYGESFQTPIFTASPEEAKVIGLIVGITASGEKYASIDLSNVTINDIAGTNIPVYGNKSVQDVMKSLGMTSIKVGQLPELFEKIQGLIGSGSDIAGAISGIEKVLGILEKVVPGIYDVTLHIGELPTEAGLYTAAGMTVNSNYNTAIGVGTLTIAQKKTDSKLVFNQKISNKHNRLTAAEAENFDFGGHIEVDGNAVGDTTGIKTYYVGKKATGETVASETPILEDGEYIETVSIIGGNYLATPIVRNYTIGEAKNTIRFEKKIVYASYDGNEHGMTAYAYNEDGDKLGEATLEYQNILQTSTNVSPAENSTAPIDAGMYRVIASYDNAESEVGTLVITKAIAQGTVTVGNADTTYGQKLNLNSVIIQTKNIAQRDIAAIQSTIACTGSDEAIGSHAITVTVPESVSRNYLRTIKVHAGTHTIKSKEVTITADSLKVQYGDAFPEFTYQISGVSDTENLGDISVVKRENGNHVGTYTLDVKVENQNPNYKYNLESGTLTIKKRTINVTIDKKQKIKGQKDPALTYTVEGNGLVEGDTLGIYLSRKSGEKVGLYDIYMDTSHLNKDYELASEPSGKDKFEIVETQAGLTNQKNDSGKSNINGTQVKSVKKQPGTVWDRIKTGDNNKPVGYFIAVLISLAAIIMIISARFQRKK